MGESATSSPTMPHRYTGEYWDEDSQLQYNRTRWYDTSTARFLSIDPFEGIPTNPASLHRYAYAHADPVQGMDPGGDRTLGELSIASDIQSVFTTTSIASGKRVLKKILFGYPPKNIGLVGELVLDWILQGFFNHINAGGITKIEFGQRVHKDLKNKCLNFNLILQKSGHNIFNGVDLICEPFFIRTGITQFNPKTQAYANPKGSVGVDIGIRHQGKIIIAIELKTGAGMSQDGFNKRRRYIGTNIIQITIKP